MFADKFTIDGIANELYKIMPGQPARERMLAEYQEVLRELGSKVAPDEAASIMVDLLRKHRAELIRLAKERAEAVAKAAAKAAELARVKAEQEAAIARQKAEEAERVSQQEINEP